MARKFRRKRSTPSIALPVFIVLGFAILVTFSLKRTEQQVVLGAAALPSQMPTVYPYPTLSTYNLIANGGFEADVNHDVQADSWSTNSHATLTTEQHHAGSYSLRHAGTDGASYALTQTVKNLVGGRRYTLSGWVTIPAVNAPLPTQRPVNFSIEIRWRDARSNEIRTDTLATYLGTTVGWNYSVANGLLAPAGATNAQIIQRVRGLAQKIYVDDLNLRDY